MTASLRARRVLTAVLLAAILMWEVTGTGPFACQPQDLRPAVTR